MNTNKVETLITDNIDIWTGAIKKRGSQGRGSNKKIELYGIKKLRELILDLAVRGLLVPQDPADEPASVLLDKIQNDLKVVIGEEKMPNLSRDKSVEDPENFHYQLPKGWLWCELQNISLFINGKAHEQYVTEDDKYVLVNSKFVSNSGDENVRKYVTERLTPLDAGDLAIVMSDVPNGRALARCYLVECSDRYTLNQRIGGLKTGQDIDRNYLHFLLDRNSYLLSCDDGKKQSNLKKIQVLSTPIALPPEAEQPRIVAKVDELMALCHQLEQQTENSIAHHQILVETLLDALTDTLATRDENGAVFFQQAWQRIADNFDVLFTTEESVEKLKQTILQLAVMGKLVPQNPNDEPASVLLEKIAAEKAQLIKDGKIKKQKALPPIGEDEKPFVLPVGWECCRLGSLIQLISGQHLKPTEYVDNNEEGLIPYITGPAEFGSLNPSYSKYTGEKRAVALKDDILITCKGSGIGKWNVSHMEIAISRQLMAVRTIEIDNEFVRLIVDSLYSYFQSKGVGIAIPGISREDITEVLVTVPPLTEQHRIVAKVEGLMTLCDQLKTQLSKAQTIQLHLTDELAKVI